MGGETTGIPSGKKIFSLTLTLLPLIKFISVECRVKLTTQNALVSISSLLPIGARLIM